MSVETKRCPGYQSPRTTYQQPPHEVENDEAHFSLGKSQCRECYQAFAIDWRERRKGETMPVKTNGGVLEAQARQHGYLVTLKVDAKGVAHVALKQTPSFGSNEFLADSGKVVNAERYVTALRIAVDRMLDYEYRAKPNERPVAGDVTYSG